MFRLPHEDGRNRTFLFLRFAGTSLKIGWRCRERRYLEMHHIKPVSEGGENATENLTLLCSGHHEAWPDLAHKDF